ncbi:lactonase family protein [Streptomyces indicus]|uniref:6-phosphogluconolactonase, cycloisomerase 2 family n=1 Tax=Streptomyces indicus TaxID=417292 RepID=A0A1G8THE8_9ACTN|nr:lactonase family protein [Streptomyces indicus]SDJ41012.1 6-phosphogluconolactonase, cycloisomerase 2 family [Streptomyces indicus]
MAGGRAYIGSFTSAGGQGVTVAEVDPATGALTVVATTDALADPSYLALADGLLYAVSEADAGSVGVFELTDGTPRLTGAPRSVGGSGPTHLTVAGGHVITANYGSGSVSALPLDGGAVRVVQHEGSGPNEARQAGPHAHQVAVDPSGRWLLSVDLGTDSVRIRPLGSLGLQGSVGSHGSLAEDEAAAQQEVALRPGSGPRHLAFHPSGSHAYVLNELDPTLTVCAWDAGPGTLTPLREIPVLLDEPKGDAYPSAITVAPDGRHLWTATRGEDAISVFALGPEGPVLTAVAGCGGHWPRDLAVHPSGRFLYAANERSGDVSWFTVDEAGVPQPAGSLAAPAASCVVFGS